jgi:hypothetical protein
MFIGLPRSGKSSFIGALWHVVLSGEIDSAFSITAQPEDREYLNRLQTDFLECKAPERTKTDFEKKVELKIKDNTTGQFVDFIFPDLSGETYESQFEFRKLTNSYVEQIGESNSLMLFVNPDYIKKPNLISEATAMLDDIEEEQPNDQNLKVEEVKWIPKMCQTQIILVDILQMIINRISKPCKVGIVISAWDLIKNLPEENESNISPSEWLKKQMPLLDQFLLANRLSFSYEVFGVSAQGGQYAETENNTELQSFTKQSERIIVQVKNDISHDITVPIKWLFNR